MSGEILFDTEIESSENCLPLCEWPMRRNLLFVMLCTLMAGCASTPDQVAKKDTQEAMLDDYNEYLKSNLLCSFMPLEIQQTVRPHLSNSMTDMANLDQIIDQQFPNRYYVADPGQTVLEQAPVPQPELPGN
jgi:hypothetical protein